MDNYDLIVVGGGISGLTFARRGALQGWRTLLLEGEGRIGGCLASHGFSGMAGGYWVEMAAHTAYNSYGALLELLDASELHRLQARQKAPWRLWNGEKPQSVFSRMHWPSLLMSLPRLLVTSKSGYNLRGYYSRTLGRQTYDDLLRHAFGAVLSQPADEFPAELLFRKKARRQDVPRSFTLPGGLAELADMLSQGYETRTGIRVDKILRQGVEMQVHAGTQSWTCRRLALALPAWESARLLPNAYPLLARQLAQIAPATVESMAVVVEKDRPALPEIAGLIGVDQDFYSVVSRDVVPDTRFRGFTFHFRPNRITHEEKLSRIARVLGVDAQSLIAVANRSSQLPALKAGHLDRVSEIDRALAGQAVALTGNYFYGVSIGDCAERSREEFTRLARSLI